MHITFIATGGSIDKDYPKKVGGYGFEIGAPAVERILDRIKPGFDYNIIPLLKKDSLDLTDADREELLRIVEKLDSTKIIITHGTDTMLQSAKTVAAVKQKVIILTGALRPERFSDSDAQFNLGVAVGAISTLEPGVYITMHGRVYPWENCTRDLDTGRFKENP